MMKLIDDEQIQQKVTEEAYMLGQISRAEGRLIEEKYCTCDEFCPKCGKKKLPQCKWPIWPTYPIPQPYPVPYYPTPYIPPVWVTSTFIGTCT